MVWFIHSTYCIIITKRPLKRLACGHSFRIRKLFKLTEIIKRVLNLNFKFLCNSWPAAVIYLCIFIYESFIMKLNEIFSYLKNSKFTKWNKYEFLVITIKESFKTKQQKKPQQPKMLKKSYVYEWLNQIIHPLKFPFVAVSRKKNYFGSRMIKQKKIERDWKWEIMKAAAAAAA